MSRSAIRESCLGRGLTSTEDRNLTSHTQTNEQGPGLEGEKGDCMQFQHLAITCYSEPGHSVAGGHTLVDDARAIPDPATLMLYFIPSGDFPEQSTPTLPSRQVGLEMAGAKRQTKEAQFAVFLVETYARARASASATG